MAETSSSAEGQKAGRDSPSDVAPSPARDHANPGHSSRSNRPPGIAQSMPVGRSAATLRTRHFTLHAVFTSTKKQGLKMAFGVRAGRSTARSRAKRQAREGFRLTCHTLPEGIDIMITSGGTISTLTRRTIRAELTELLDRARALTPPRIDRRATAR